MNPLAIRWTDQMQQALADLQQRALLRRLLAYAQQHGVWLYAVGGTLRDLCLGRAAHDVDLALSGDALGFAHGFADHLGAAYVPMDAERGEARVVYRKREVIDFARFKGDSISDDLRHRDFTINAMACPLATLLTQAAPEVLDPHSGWHDLQARLIRMVSDWSFREDPVRLLRAFRLAATLDCAIAPSTLAAMESMAPLLATMAAERIHSELLKLFATARSGPHVVTMAGLGLVDVLFPELAMTHGIFPQPGERHDVFEHSIATYQAVEDLSNASLPYLTGMAQAVGEYQRDAERRALVKWAALLHAVGSTASSRTAATGPPLDPCDAASSGQRSEQIGSRLKLSRKQIERLKTLIAHHGQLAELARLDQHGRLTLRLVHSWCKAVGEEMVGVFLLAIGHTLARRFVDTPTYGVAALDQLAARLWELYRSRILPVITSPRLVTGNDLQHLFNLTPGPRFKALLGELEIAQVEGRVHTRAEALRWVEEQLARL
jgi:poly(A) polymerase